MSFESRSAPNCFCKCFRSKGFELSATFRSITTHTPACNKMLLITDRAIFSAAFWLGDSVAVTTGKVKRRTAESGPEIALDGRSVLINKLHCAFIALTELCL
jgi:hypothetical protein